MFGPKYSTKLLSSKEMLQLQAYIDEANAEGYYAISGITIAHVYFVIIMEKENY